MIEAEQIMKRCQVGTRNYDEANNLHAGYVPMERCGQHHKAIEITLQPRTHYDSCRYRRARPHARIHESTHARTHARTHA